jgi:O-antigen ligase
MNLLKRYLPVSDRNVFLAFGLLFLASLAFAIFRKTILPLGIPVVAVGTLLVLTNYRVLYYLLIFTLPFSMQLPLVPGLDMDVPSEPLMLVVSGCFIFTLLLGTKPDKRFFQHPIVIVIGLMYLWAFFGTLISVDTLKTIKYLLAKAWYIIPFLLFTGSIIRNVADIRRIIWLFLLPLLLLVVVVVLKHALLGFAFHMVQRSVDPFFKNHVIYAATLALIIPFIFTLFQGSSAWVKAFLGIALLILLVGVGFSYTRASWLSLPLAGFYYVAIRFKLTKLSVFVAYIGAVAAFIYFIAGNNFMLYSPDFEKTIFNRDNFGKHLEATYKLEDVSGMERVYRWIAAVEMASDRPIMGSGPNTFYPEYRKYTVSSFQTYVSDNPEHSTTHNYFLLQLAEQGVIGLTLFMTLIAMLLILPQKLYHRTRNPEFRAAIIGSGLCLFVIIFHLTLNELVEVDKIGSFFFIATAFLIKLDIWTKEESLAKAEA